MSTITNSKAIDKVLTRRVEKIYPSKEALKKLLLSGKKIRLYQGFDPSSPNLHFGHLVGLLKLKEFQQLGHEVIFLIGDFTGMIGDPTGKLKTRKVLTRNQVQKNTETYKNQAKKLLDFEGKNPVKLKFNYDWNSKLSSIDILQLTRQITVRQLLERDMFKKRLAKGREISVEEYLYPLFQAYDSLAMDVDLEIGGSDQMFNMLVGRDLIKKVKNKEKFVLTTKLITDDKGNKIGKTEDNVINIASSPNEFFSQIMSIADEAIIPGLELITELPLSEIENIKKALKAGKNPMESKKRLAWELTKMLNNKKSADKAQSEFEKVHQQNKTPTNMPTFPLSKLSKNPINPIDLLVETGLAPSRAEAKRLIQQNAITHYPSSITHPLPITHHSSSINIEPGSILKVGKRKWLKII